MTVAKKTKKTSAPDPADTDKSPVAANAKTVAKKRVLPSTSRKAATKKKTTGQKRAVTKTVLQEPSVADIRLRAYFIAERRVQLALQGDPARDWLEAKQQLLQESRQARI